MSTTSSRTIVPSRGVLASVLGRSSTGIAMALLLFTALIWLRLRLVTDVPRQAYAEPKAQGQAQHEAETKPSEESDVAPVTTPHADDR